MSEMKISFEIDANNAMWDILDGLAVVLLKEIKKDAESTMSYPNCHPDDYKASKKRIKAVNMLLDYYGVKDDE